MTTNFIPIGGGHSINADAITRVEWGRSQAGEITGADVFQTSGGKVHLEGTNAAELHAALHPADVADYTDDPPPAGEPGPVTDTPPIVPPPSVNGAATGKKDKDKGKKAGE